MAVIGWISLEVNLVCQNLTKLRILVKFRSHRALYYGDSIGSTPYSFTFSESPEFSTFTQLFSRRLNVFWRLQSHVNNSNFSDFSNLKNTQICQSCVNYVLVGGLSPQNYVTESHFCKFYNNLQNFSHGMYYFYVNKKIFIFCQPLQYGLILRY